MRRFMILPSLAGLLLGAISVVLGQEAQPGKNDDDNGYVQISIFAKALELIRQDYVDENKTSYHDLINAAMKGMLSSLDPHSQFMDPEDFRDMQDDTRSRFNGLGIEVSMKNGLPTVITAMEDTPAAKAGVLSGDQILRINGISTERMDLQDAINVLRGPAGAKITLTLLRPSTKEIKEYTGKTERCSCDSRLKYASPAKTTAFLARSSPPRVNRLGDEPPEKLITAVCS